MYIYTKKLSDCAINDEYDPLNLKNSTKKKKFYQKKKNCPVHVQFNPQSIRYVHEGQIKGMDLTKI